jgi:hypothetical protein
MLVWNSKGSIAYEQCFQRFEQMSRIKIRFAVKLNLWQNGEELGDLY